MAGGRALGRWRVATAVFLVAIAVALAAMGVWLVLENEGSGPSLALAALIAPAGAWTAYFGLGVALNRSTVEIGRRRLVACSGPMRTWFEQSDLGVATDEIVSAQVSPMGDAATESFVVVLTTRGGEVALPSAGFGLDRELADFVVAELGEYVAGRARSGRPHQDGTT